LLTVIEEKWEAAAAEEEEEEEEAALALAVSNLYPRTFYERRAMLLSIRLIDTRASSMDEGSFKH
jgi:hypothetical protein